MGAKEFLRLRRLKAAEQVAAVCYRIGKRGVEFLLVQTGGGRWTFPKGNAEPGLTHAQSAALEAFEEAGVHGRMAEDCFARYSSRKRSGANSSAPVIIHAFLCEVARLDPPQESQRNPTWFSAAKAQRRLHEGRVAEEAVELAHVVDRAAARVRGVRSGAAPAFAAAPTDPLQRVAFEAGQAMADPVRLLEAAFARDLQYRGRLRKSTIQLAVNAQEREVLRLNPQPEEAGEPDSAWATEGRARGPATKTAPKRLPN
jgi:8-oxo-dGTP pyrophosphatase MutT (NUDIX family)